LAGGAELTGLANPFSPQLVRSAPAGRNPAQVNTNGDRQVQRLQVARRELALESTIRKLDRYDLLILDDIAYVTKDQAETSVLFELIAARDERRSMLITAI
jgi:hypothetical protein